MCVVWFQFIVVIYVRCILFAGPYLIVITRREKVGEIDQRPIWKVTGTEVISYQRTLLHLNEQQVLVYTLVHKKTKPKNF